MNEHDLIKAMATDFKNQHMGSFWRKIHGNEYQAGFPDIVAALPDVAALCEFKYCKDDRLLLGPFRDMAKELLTGLQYAELTMLGALSDTCPLRARVLIGCPVEDESGNSYDMAFGCDVDDLKRYWQFSAADVAGVAVHARLHEGEWQWPSVPFPTGAPIGLEFQLRKTPSSEHWRVGQLVLGMRRYKVFDVRVKLDAGISYE